ncbi:prephenate dehydrogenase/arogenate dehydrogenase family protein [Achromobacter sp. ACM03]|uniref:Arogenate dehydrogenase n=1 Tax=Achromobacter aegrifaciens TaxID=1287736 RepID=A0AAD2IVM1_ACHAE|nr:MULTISPECIES: prephenate dehydrogenase/arogenate dehydrogenase family protein [Achromobacter]MBD9434261.1 prephenate dehydrogenase/arogenate dehydrogenase family protein [Achromobacter sp. ACM03]CAB3883209.1 Cyclohexadienyl dehydrogenase [Achromobacter aegrifaciens]CAB3900154.1 Cyclohexadienyl dehydrogenase [Achromobacter aegrifaciens]CUI47359.1 Arogenate dehydrogenase [Achromobacter aegrifaciens]
MNDASPKSDQGAAGPLIPVLAVVGVGLIGGSFAAALRRAGQVGRVLGVGRNAQSLARAVELGLIDEAASAEDAAARADLILLATPVGGLGDVLSRMRAHLRPDTVLTDGGSTKAEVVEAARAALGDRIAQFVPGHPIAGAERTGPEAADADLYRKRTVILTPLAENGAASLELVRRAWQACGADVIDMDADAHDRVLASVSHLPHLLSAVYMEQVAEATDASTRLALAGSGFRDFTRIAAGSPEMWRDIFLSNRDAMLAELADVRTVLDRAERAIADGDGAALLTLLDTAARARRNWRKE